MTTRFAALAAVLVWGCATELDLSEATQAGQNLNGQNLNGQNLNGQNLNGQNLNGQNLNGPDNGTFTIWTSLEGVSLQGKVFDTTRLSSTVFTGIKGASMVTGADMVQAELDAMRGDGRMVRMRIRSIVPPEAGETAWRYFVEYREDDLIWYPICEDASGPIAAIPINGIWDHRQGVEGGGAHLADPTKFTFACETTGAIGKCARIGYEPWATVGGVQLTNHHAACVRLMRADYCGDGTPYTQDGNRVNLYDALGIQDDTEAWVFEAEWDQDGARCFHVLNRSNQDVPCYGHRVATACGAPSNFSSGTLLMDETPSAGLTP